MIEIKPFTTDSITDVIDFEKRLRAEEDFYYWNIDDEYRQNIEASFTNPAFQNAVSLLAYADGKVVGRIDATLLPSRQDGTINRAWLDWICVIKSWRHQGIAQQLLSALRRELKMLGVNTLIALIASNEEAQRFYRAVENASIQDQGIWIDL